MSTTVRSLAPLEAAQAVANQNALRLDLLKLRAGLIFHADVVGPAITVANATDLASSIALITALQVAYTAHIGSACSATTGQGAHIAADATNVLTSPTPTDLASAETAVNELKTQYNAHRVLTSSHPLADGTNSVATANGTDQTTTNALANALKTAFNAHIAAAFSSTATALVNP